MLDKSVERMRELEIALDGRVTLAMSNRLQIEEVLVGADLVIGAVLVPGAVAPKLVTREMLGLMKPGAVLVDVAIDQGGCFETSHATTHDDPVFEVDGIVHYCVANMPGAVPVTSTKALTNVTLPYVEAIADQGRARAIAEDPALAKGVNVVGGKITYEAVAEAHGLRTRRSQPRWRRTRLGGRRLSRAVSRRLSAGVAALFDGRDLDHGDVTRCRQRQDRDARRTPSSISPRTVSISCVDYRHAAGLRDRARCRRRRCVAGRGRVGRRGLGHARERRPCGRWPRSSESRGARARERRAARRVPAAAGRSGGRRPAARALEGQGHDGGPLGADGHRHGGRRSRPTPTGSPTR